MGLAALGAASGASAADLGGMSYKDTPVYDSGKGWMVRGRMLWIVPDAGSNGDGVLWDDTSISNEVIPELDISYFFNRNLAVELILGTSKHTAKIHDGGYTEDLGNVWLLPPTLTLQYHFNLNDTIKPYIGGGVNYTIFYGEEGALDALGGLDNTWGWAAQAGVDIKIAGNWYANIDVKKLWLDADVADTGVEVDIDPWIVGVGLGYKFGGSPAPLK
jgi:outer membrane protein